MVSPVTGILLQCGISRNGSSTLRASRPPDESRPLIRRFHGVDAKACPKSRPNPYRWGKSV
jgi:hypothetical protein